MIFWNCCSLSLELLQLTFLKHKSYSLKSSVSLLLDLVVKSYTEKFKNFKKGYITILTSFKTQPISTHYYELSD